MDGWVDGKGLSYCGLQNKHTRTTHTAHTAHSHSIQGQNSVCVPGGGGGRKEQMIIIIRAGGVRRGREREFPGARKTGGGQAIRAAFHEPHPFTIHHPLSTIHPRLYPLPGAFFPSVQPRLRALLPFSPSVGICWGANTLSNVSVLVGVVIRT